MSAQVESALPAAALPGTAAARPAGAIQRLLAAAGERLNPILVKETRQALKSRQFTITFGLLLLFAWVWSIVGVAMIGPEVWHGSFGPEMFVGYYFILAFPLLVIVPFGAFRSLAAEQEDRTYELLWITALGPRQIISGKLGSAAVQMIVYLSAVSPCLAFTYMLRGIDFPTILFIIGYTVLGSLGLSLLGLLAGTLSSERHWQVVISVLAIAGLLYTFGMGCAATMMVLNEGDLPFLLPEFWQAVGGVLTGYASYFVLLFFAAVAQITFRSDNRSTRLRVTMLAQQVLFTGWMAWVWVGPARGDEELFYAFLILLGLHWYAMGALMTGESPELSPRVKRHLPQSFLGRAFLTWFNPGPGTGYVFAVGSLLAGLALAAIGLAAVELLQPSGMSRWSSNDAVAILSLGTAIASYVTIYLGVGLLLLRAVRRFAPVGLLLAPLVHVMLVLLGVGVPFVIHSMTMAWRHTSWFMLHVTNPFWTSAYLVDRSPWPPEAPLLLMLLPAAALLVLLLNLPGVARELRHVRIAPPKRVAEEDAQLAAEVSPPQPVHTSPWD